MHLKMELERTATVSRDRLVLLMRLLGPRQMRIVQQTTLCGLQHRWQRENQRGSEVALVLQVVMTHRRGLFTAFPGEQEYRSPRLYMWTKRVVVGSVMRQFDVTLSGVRTLFSLSRDITMGIYLKHVTTRVG